MLVLFIVVIDLDAHAVLQLSLLRYMIACCSYLNPKNHILNLFNSISGKVELNAPTDHVACKILACCTRCLRLAVTTPVANANELGMYALLNKPDLNGDLSH